MHSVRAYRSGSRALQLIRCDRGDGGAPTALVRDPVQRVFGRVLTVAPQTAPATQVDRSNEQRSLHGSRSTTSPSTLQVHYRTHNSPPTVPTLSHISPVHISQPICRIIILIRSSHPRPGLPSGPFPSGLPTKTLYVFLFSPLRAARLAHLIVLSLIAQVISYVQRTT